MADVKKNPNALKVMLILACFVIIIAGMKAAKDILVPFLFSVFISIILSSLLYWLNRKKIPMIVSLLFVSLCVVGAVFLLVLLFKSSFHDFTQSLPLYQEKLKVLISHISTILGRFNIDLSEKQIMEYIDPGAAMQFVSVILASLKSLLSNAFFIIIIVVFILFEAATLPAKMNSALEGSRFTFDHIKEIMANINHYMVIKTYMSLATGILVTLWLTILGIDYPFLWGLLAFMFNFVPNIGSIIAAIPAILLALVQAGYGTAALTAGGYIVFNVGISNFIEPRFMGQGLGISTLVVFLSLIFWGWVLGPVGMVLSIPLTMTMKIALSCSEETSWISTLLGNKKT
ncbi:MAG: AI-2E family transporter [Desulfobacteraceae bacterium]|jgi:predicted PurR-regulated permease PerM